MDFIDMRGTLGKSRKIKICYFTGIERDSKITAMRVLNFNAFPTQDFQDSQGRRRGELLSMLRTMYVVTSAENAHLLT